MNFGKLMQLPSVNAIIGGLLIYLLIYLSNLGSPMLGAVISSMPVGLLGLMAIEDNYTKKRYTSAAVYVNIIIVIMWLINNYNAHRINDTNTIILIGFLTWLVLSIIYYFVARHTQKK